MSLKSERLKKLETELHDLEKWLNLGLVPKKDVEKHTEEIKNIKGKIGEEKERLRYLKENGDAEEYVAPKRTNARQAYAEPHTMPGMDISATDTGLDMENDTFDMETSGGGAEAEAAEENTTFEEDDEDPFSDKNRWRRGILEDPDNDNW